MSFYYNGFGTQTPKVSISQTDSATLAAEFCSPTEAQSRLLPILYRRTTVQRRHSVLLEPSGSHNGGAADPINQTFYTLAHDRHDRGPTTATRMQAYERYVSELGVSASRKAIVASGMELDSITHLITVSCTGFSAPGLDIALVRELGLSPDIARTHIGFMGCHGAMNAIRVANAFVEADPNHRVLSCAVELCSLHHQYGWHPERIVSNALFADGAAAFVASKNRQPDSTPQLEHVASGSFVVPGTESMMSWRISDHGYEMTLSPRVPEIIRESLPDWLSPWLEKQGYGLSDIGGWAVHPGGPRILDATAAALQLKQEDLSASRDVLKQYGNMSSPTVLFVLKQLQRKQIAGPYVMLGYGPGLTIEAALLRSSD
ncbi:type III polyketide synthase [Novipirellula artificiosorum]|uniref:Alpha-pyrone synthesis polyketide synthase-like Pks18 n=1 Tax=Novipirellula artificiosorum TaxID=2528016 RepID=A0A5C6D6Q5_9BACT|nr:type III polyketide synthase [Novipirellula artificiosorum]TWU31381.1 Alpha-pyrone synthesis polyketide synthase-like Pks18 [Novipirellula artificiosorum]